MTHEDQDKTRDPVEDLRELVEALVTLRDNEKDKEFSLNVDEACAAAIVTIMEHRFPPPTEPGSETGHRAAQDSESKAQDPSQTSSRPPLAIDDIKDFVVLELNPRRTGEKLAVLWRILRPRARSWLPI